MARELCFEQRAASPEIPLNLIKLCISEVEVSKFRGSNHDASIYIAYLVDFEAVYLLILRLPMV